MLHGSVGKLGLASYARGRTPGQAPRWAVALTLLGLLCGCAHYRMGMRSLYPPDIHTVYVPIFASGTLRRNQGERLTEAVIKAIESHTPLKVVDSPDADSVLTGRIVRDEKRVTAQSSLDAPRELEFQYRVEINWANRRGDTIRAGRTAVFSPRDVPILGTGSFVPEGGQSLVTAQQRAIDDVAVQVVSLMEEPW